MENKYLYNQIIRVDFQLVLALKTADFNDFMEALNHLQTVSKLIFGKEFSINEFIKNIKFNVNETIELHRWINADSSKHVDIPKEYKQKVIISVYQLTQYLKHYAESMTLAS